MKGIVVKKNEHGQFESVRVCDPEGKEHTIRWTNLGAACVKASWTKGFPSIDMDTEPLKQALRALYTHLSDAYRAAHDVGLADTSRADEAKAALASSKTAKAGAVQALKNVCELLASRINHKGTRKAALVVTDTSIEYLYGVLTKTGGLVAEATFVKNAMPHIVRWIVGYSVADAEKAVSAENKTENDKKQREKKDRNAEKDNAQAALNATEEKVAKLEKADFEQRVNAQKLRDAIYAGVEAGKIDREYSLVLLDLIG